MKNISVEQAKIEINNIHNSQCDTCYKTYMEQSCKNCPYFYRLKQLCDVIQQKQK